MAAELAWVAHAPGSGAGGIHCGLCAGVAPGLQKEASSRGSMRHLLDIVTACVSFLGQLAHAMVSHPVLRPHPVLLREVPCGYVFPPTSPPPHPCPMAFATAASFRSPFHRACVGPGLLCGTPQLDGERCQGGPRVVQGAGSSPPADGQQQPPAGHLLGCHRVPPGAGRGGGSGGADSQLFRVQAHRIKRERGGWGEPLHSRVG